MLTTGSDARMCAPRFGVRGGVVIAGGFLLHLALGSYYMFGNYSPYIISYLRNRTDDKHVRNVDALWVTGFGNIGNTIGMVLGGVLDRMYGPQIASGLGCVIYCSSVLVTYFSVQFRLALVVLTYGFTSNLGNFMAYGPPVQTAIKWLPNRPTLASGLVVCGFGGGTLVFSQVLTAYINPDNVSPDLKTGDGEKYFTDPELLDRVPKSFLVLGSIYLAMQIVGILCLKNPPPQLPSLVSVEVPVNTVDGYGQPDWPKSQVVDTMASEGISETTPLVPHEKSNRMSVKEVIQKAMKNRSFYIIWFTILCNMFGMQFVSGVYKAYGQTFIKDDKFLALSIAISSVFNCVGRPLWGLLKDRFGYKVAIWLITAGFAVVTGTFVLTEHMGKAGFLLWLCLMFLFYSGIWSVMPATCSKLYGVENTMITFGLTGVATAIAAITAGVTGVTLKSQIGWHGLFFLSSGIISLAFFFTFFFNARDGAGKKI